MGILIGAGRAKPVSPNELLGIAPFSTTKAYKQGGFVLYNNTFYRFSADHSAGAWTGTDVVEFSTLNLILASIGDPRIKPLSSHTPTEGDVLFYDRAREEYCTVSADEVDNVLKDYNETRYETNHDTFVGVVGGKARFVAADDATDSSGKFSNDQAATACYYRIEIDNAVAGSITLKTTVGEASWNIPETTLTWDAGTAMATIVSKFTALNRAYCTFKALADGNGVGLEIGGYSTNVMTYYNVSGCTVIDCSGYAFYLSQNPSQKVLGTFDPNAAHTYLGKGVHHNFRGVNAASILTGKGLVANSTVCICNDGYDYSYRTGLNFAKWKTWASASGSADFVDDGEGGTQGTHGSVMKQSEFEADVASKVGTTEPTAGTKEHEEWQMAQYYNHLFTDQSGDYATLRQQYESWYGTMTSLYDAYLMSHMMKIDAESGIVAMMSGNGDLQTSVKADVVNVTYDYLIIPAYPPEYNAKHYGVSGSEGFGAGCYYHPEPADLGLMFRDDLMPLINDSTTRRGSGTKLTNSLYRGSCADRNGNNTWFFYGRVGCLDLSIRCIGFFRCRPVLALPLQS